MSKSIFVIGLLLCLVGPASAQEAPPPPAGRAAWCQENPDKCQQLKQRMQDKCAADPQRCDEMKARAAQLREECKADPEACKEKRRQWRERRKQRRAGQATPPQ
jgi:hypothetical protein